MLRWFLLLALIAGCGRSAPPWYRNLAVGDTALPGDSRPSGDTAPAAWVLIDDFNRPDNDTPGNGWTLMPGGADRSYLANNRLSIDPVADYPEGAIFRPASEALENLRARVIFNTTDFTNFPQIWTRVVNATLSSTAYLFYVSSDVDEIGVIRHVDGSWVQNWFAAQALVANRDYRLEVRAENINANTEVELEMTVTDLTTSLVVFSRLWVDSGPGIILGPGRQALSGYMRGSIRYDDFEVLDLDTP